MILSYLTIALRNVRRYKGYSFITVSGLAVGLACSLLILLFVQHQLSYDRFHQQAASIYRVEQDQYYSGRPYHVYVTPYPCGPVWKEEIPEIVDAARVGRCGGRLFRHGERAFFEQNVIAVDPAFFTMFDFALRQGDRHTVLNDRYAVVISSEIARKYFGDDDPVGQILSVNNQFNLTVTGVLAGIPSASTLRPEIVVHFDFTRDLGDYRDSWGSNNIFTFIQLAQNCDPAVVHAKLTQVVNNHRSSPSPTQFMAAPLVAIHLYGYFGFETGSKAMLTLTILMIIAGFVLLIACINFMNLTTARSARRAREIGLRKVVGAFRFNLIVQFLGESLALALLAVMLSLVLVRLLLPPLNALTGMDLTTASLLQVKFLSGLLIITLLTGLLAGSYPAFFLSAFKPVRVLRGQFSQSSNPVLRRILVIVQFTLSIILIIGTLVIRRQLHFMREKDLGFDQEQVITVHMQGDIARHYEALKRELTQQPEILGVTASSHRPTNIGSNSGNIDWDGKEPEATLVVGISAADYDYVETLGIPLRAGRSFSREVASDPVTEGRGALVINETLARIIQKDDIINSRLRISGVEGTIIGVMQDFHFKSARDPIEPLALFLAPSNFTYILIRLQPGDPDQSLAAVRAIWNRVLPSFPFEYRFLDEDFDWMYRQETMMSRLFSYFAVLAVIIACLGLFGLASFTAEQRMREIGIRKVLGASVVSVVVLMTNQFTRWILAANIIALPIAFWLARQYLGTYAYHTNLTGFLFIGTALLTFGIAFFTVAYQSIRAALTDPARTLKYE